MTTLEVAALICAGSLALGGLHCLTVGVYDWVRWGRNQTATDCLLAGSLFLVIAGLLAWLALS